MIQPARLYECEVTHQRLRPRRNGFTYRVFMIEIDLDQLAETAAGTRGLGHNRFNFHTIDDRDHIALGLPGGIRPNLVEWLARQGKTVPPDARIRLVTFPRVLGYGFNPVSFYYVADAGGLPLLAVAEVVNTFREMKLYMVDGPGDSGWRRRLPKNFYVSPFSDPGDNFDFRLGIPGEDWRVNIDDLDGDGNKVLLSAIRGRSRPLTSARLLRYTVKYPLLSLKIIGGIHWHALLLWLRRFPYFRKDDRRESQTGVMRPAHFRETIPENQRRS